VSVSGSDGIDGRPPSRISLRPQHLLPLDGKTAAGTCASAGAAAAGAAGKRGAGRRINIGSAANVPNMEALPELEIELEPESAPGFTRSGEFDGFSQYREQTSDDDGDVADEISELNDTYMHDQPEGLVTEDHGDSGEYQVDEQLRIELERELNGSPGRFEYEIRSKGTHVFS
jgi:hypothetical protein